MTDILIAAGILGGMGLAFGLILALASKVFYVETDPRLDQLNEAVRDLYLGEILPCIRKGLCGSIYTQVSDVEDEINGLLTYDRKVEKMDPEVMLPIAQALQAAIEE